jgi:nicotinate-nucleotide adenylyltransferase
MAHPQTSHGPSRVALFGGSFDPVHLGHVEIARLAADQLDLDQVRFLPCRVSPHKTGDPAPAPGDDRLAMLRLATAGLPWAEIDDHDLVAPPPSYSFRTVGAMRARFPAARLFWLLGRDQWDALPRWKHPERLAEVVEFIVFSRDGDPEPRAGWTMHHLRGSHPASATAIRRAAADGDEPPWLDPSVAAYIRCHALYQAT